MTTTKLDLTGLKCPLPALKTRKALKAMTPGDFLEVHCTDPLSVIDIPNLIRETGDKVEITERAEQRIVFLIEKANGSIEKSNGASPTARINALVDTLPFAYRHPCRLLSQFDALRRGAEVELCLRHARPGLACVHVKPTAHGYNGVRA